MKLLYCMTTTIKRSQEKIMMKTSNIFPLHNASPFFSKIFIIIHFSYWFIPRKSGAHVPEKENVPSNLLRYFKYLCLNDFLITKMQIFLLKNKASLRSILFTLYYSLTYFQLAWNCIIISNELDHLQLTIDYLNIVL